MQISNTEPKRLSAGLSQLAGGRYQAVHAMAMGMLAQDREDSVAYFLLGIIGYEHKNYKKALELFRQASALDLSSVRYRTHCAQTLSILGHQSEARDIALEASKLPVQDAYVADTLGVVLSRTGLHAQAAPMFQRAVALDDRPANFHYNLASSLQFMGDMDDAHAAYLRAVHRNRKLYRAWSSLVALRKQTADANHLSDLYELFDTFDGHQDARLHLGHAIAKTLEDLDRHPESLTWLQRAKAGKRASLGFDIETDLHNFSAARQTLESTSASARATASAQTPIFIIGLPRTGTTLVDRILSSHSDVHSMGELNTFAGLIKEATETGSNLVMDAETLRAGAGLDLTKIGQRYMQDTTALAQAAPCRVDKMPLNFFYAGLIHQALPNARIIALRRGAMDSCLSNYRQLFSVSYSYYNYTFDLRDTARFYRGFDALMAHWRAQIPADRFTEIAYEDIVFDQENQTRRLLEFCGLNWQEACMRFHENTAPVSTASSVQVRQPLYSGSIGRWKKYGDALTGLKDDLGDLVTDT